MARKATAPKPQSTVAASAQSVTMMAKILGQATKKVRATLEPGTYDLDEVVSVRVNGKVTVGEDYEQRVVAKADPWALLAVALSKLNGVTVDAIAREAEAMDAKEIKGLKAKASEAIQGFKDATVTACKGKVTVKGTVQVTTL